MSDQLLPYDSPRNALINTLVLVREQQEKNLSMLRAIAPHGIQIKCVVVEDAHDFVISTAEFYNLWQAEYPRCCNKPVDLEVVQPPGKAESQA